MYEANPNAQRLFAVSRLKGTAPFYYTEVQDCVGHQIKLKTLVDAGWVHSEKGKGDTKLRYRIKREAYRRVKTVFAADIAELERTGEKMKGYEEQKVLMPAPDDARVSRMIGEIWETVSDESD